MKVELVWEDDVWIASVPDVPGCHTYGTSLPQVTRRLREALRLFLHSVPPLEPEPILPPDAADAVGRSRRAREGVAAAHATTRDAARTLTAIGLSRRDAATLLGISHQRVQQLLDRR